MIVCHCTAVSDRDVRAHAEQGIRCVDELGPYCEAGQVCGGCRSTVERLLARHAVHDAVLAG